MEKRMRSFMLGWACAGVLLSGLPLEAAEEELSPATPLVELTSTNEVAPYEAPVFGPNLPITTSSTNGPPSLADVGENMPQPVPLPMPIEPGMTVEESRRSFMQIQGMLDTALYAIERTRRDSEAAALRTEEEVNTRLKAIEQSFQIQREREIEAFEKSNRNMLIIAGAFAGVGFLAMLITSVFHMRAMNRLAGMTGFGGGFGAGGPEALEGFDERLVSMPASNPGGTRLLSAIERLEKRVFELEHTSQFPLEEGSSGTNGELSNDDPDAEPNGNAAGVGMDEVSMSLGKGQSLLNLGKAEEALACFDRVVELDPQNAEALVKRGTALEKMDRLEEAVASYDQAIAVNQAMTLAYLYKGGLFNRMEKFDEALACYEQALKYQNKSGASQVSVVSG